MYARTPFPSCFSVRIYKALGAWKKTDVNSFGLRRRLMALSHIIPGARLALELGDGSTISSLRSALMIMLGSRILLTPDTEFNREAGMPG